ncbi:GH25 family lysozyme [Schleiferilactobacillus shenzhenensis]|uniref:Lysozyme n=1 Tax=Schleiferilactobacillus shenzhenensis LY-73 TaxID=1231336 RepID=U4TJ27_9LACO|nr:GH25 family lysozyme [Schleiferilactobacillus shenzhenensis]ERL64214.1 hypothetical protein L248_1492 [Schleiferilactobacillus shenzhenensis LY-73]
MRRPAPIYANTFRRHWPWWLLLLGAVIAGAAFLLWRQFAPVNLTKGQYPVNGTLVSQTDGTVDFQALHQDGARFVYVHAAQGASYQDDRVGENLASAQGARLAVGIEHTLSFDTTPAAQIANLTKAVNGSWGDLPIAVSLSLYGDYETTPPSQATVTALLKAIAAGLQKNGRSMIVRTTSDLAQRYARAGHFSLWLSDAESAKASVLFLQRGAFPHNSALPLVTFNGDRTRWQQEFHVTLTASAQAGGQP